MLRERPKTWAIFAAICLVTYFLSFVVAPWAITGITRFGEISNYESSIQEEKQPQETAPSDEETKKNEDATKMFSNMLEVVCNISKYLGIVIVVYGIFQFVLAFSRDDSEAVSRGLSVLVVGAILLGASFLLPNILSGGFNAKD